MFHFKIHYRLVNRGLIALRTVSKRRCAHTEIIFVVLGLVGLGGF